MTLSCVRSVAAALTCLGLTFSGASARAAAAPAARQPVVVELFTAQGCAACPQANALLQELAARKGVLALTFPVDYWDFLGWADTYASPEFTARQKAYVARFKLREIGTPEIVVDGRREAQGFDRNKVQALIEADRGRRPSRPKVRVSAGGTRVRVSAGAAPSPGAEVWLVRYDPTERTTKVTAGENKGKTVVQQNLVRELVRLGGWFGRERSYRAPPAKADGLVSVVLVQGAKGGPLLVVGRS